MFTLGPKGVRSKISLTSRNQDYQHKALTIFRKKVKPLGAYSGTTGVSQVPNLAEIWKSRYQQQASTISRKVSA